MQEAIPFRTYFPGGTTASINGAAARDSSRDNNKALDLAANGGDGHVGKLVAENSIIVFGRRGCCMCHVVKRLLLGLGVNPPVYEVDEEEEAQVVRELTRINGEETVVGQLPVVFVGGRLFGGLERVMETHISGELVPILKDAGALWL